MRNKLSSFLPAIMILLAISFTVFSSGCSGTDNGGSSTPAAPDTIGSNPVTSTQGAPSSFVVTAAYSVGASGVNYPINMSWTDNSNDEDGFVLQYLDSTNGWTDVTSFPRDTVSYSDYWTNNPNGMFVRVRAYNSSATCYSNTVLITVSIP